MNLGRALSPARSSSGSIASGRIELIIGPMFAGKTTELMRRLRREIFAQRSCFVIKYGKDIRYSTEAMASHDQAKVKVQAAVNTLSDVEDRWKQFDVIGIDEGQFFPDLLQFATTAADGGKTVIVSALDGDYLRKPFGQVCDLIPHCEVIDKLSAVCMVCHRCPGSFTRRTVSSNEQELIGGAEMYVAACRDCFSAHREISVAAVAQYKASVKEVESSFFTEEPSSSSSSSPTSPRSSLCEDGAGAPRKRVKVEGGQSHH